MLRAGSALTGYAIEASDGQIGTVSDFLFDDESWKIRWLVVDTGTWLSGRKVLLHPSALEKADYERHALHVGLTKLQIEKSPSIFSDQPVSWQMERHLYDYYQWDPVWGGSNYFGVRPNAIATPLSSPTLFGGAVAAEADDPLPEHGDPHLRSVAAVTGYHVQATDCPIGHVEGILIDDVSWTIGYLIIDTKNWWPGEHVLMSPYAVREVSWDDQQIRLDVSSDQVKACSPWNPLVVTDQPYEQRLHAYEKKLHKHYGWPGYGWF